MTATSATSPGTAANDTSVGTEAWGALSSVLTSDNTRAVVTNAGTTSNYLKATNFGFAIPSGSTIEGILVEVERRAITGGGAISTMDNSIRLVKAGTITGKNLASPDVWPSSDAYKSYGGENETWGLVWTTDDINATDFGVVISAKDSTGEIAIAGIDHIRITIYYTDAYESAPQVQEDGVIRLYGHAYRMQGAVRVTQATQWPGKVVIGDFSKSSTPFISEFELRDWRGGQGLYRYEDVEGQRDRFWTSEGMDNLWSGALTLALATPSIGRPTDATLKTTDTGATWAATVVGAGVTLRGVGAFDANTAWMVGAGGVIYATTNGGVAWTAQTSGVSTTLYGMAAASATAAVAMGAAGVALYTTNGGTTWTAGTSGVATDLYSVTMPAFNRNHAVGAGGVIINSNDGGATWGSQTSGVATALYGVVAADASNIWAVGAAGVIRKTTNGGVAWTAQTSGVSTQLNAVAAFDASNAWAVGASGTVLNTTDGGTTWTDRTAALGIAATLNGVVAFSATTAIVVGAGGVIKKTVDNGVNWTTPISGTTGDLLAVGKGSASVAWTAGATGVTDASPILGVLDNTLVAAYGAQVWQYTSGAWAAIVDTLPAAPVANPVVFATNLYWPTGVAGQAQGYSYQTAPGAVATDVPFAAGPPIDPRVMSFITWDNKLYALDTGFVLYSSTTGAAGSWTTLAGITLDTTFTTTYGQLVVYDDAEGNPIIWALTHQGPFLYDATNDKWFRSRYQFPYNAVGARVAYGAPFGDSLFVLSGPSEVTELTMGGNALVVRDVSPGNPDGHPTTLTGATFNNWAASDRFLFVLASTSTRNALFVWNGRGWVPYYVATVASSNPTRGIVLLGTTLYFTDYDATAGNITRSLDLGSASGLRANPLVSTTRTYAAAGHVIAPDFGAGYEAQVKTALSLKVRVRGLATASETLTVEYALDGGSSYTTLGSAITSTTSGISSGAGEVTLRFGTNNRGVAFNSIRFRITAASAGSANAPKMEYASLQFYKNPDILWGHTVRLDMRGDAPDGRSPRKQREDLRVAISSPTLGTFAHRDDADNLRSYLVKVLNPEGVEQTGPNEDGIYTVFLHQMNQVS